MIFNPFAPQAAESQPGMNADMVGSSSRESIEVSGPSDLRKREVTDGWIEVMKHASDTAVDVGMQPGEFYDNFETQFQETPPPLYSVQPAAADTYTGTGYAGYTPASPAAEATHRSDMTADARQQLDDFFTDDPQLKYAQADINAIGGDQADQANQSYPLDSASQTSMTDADKHFLLDYGIQPPAAANTLAAVPMPRTEGIAPWDVPVEAGMTNPSGVPQVVADAERLRQEMAQPSEAEDTAARLQEARDNLNTIYGPAA